MTDVEKKLPKRVEYDEEGFRVSTPPEIAEYKAKRIRNETVADLGCGIGIQSIYFSRYFKQVFAVEIKSERLNIARKNFKKFHSRNVITINGDALDKSVIEKLRDVDIIFSDPSRPRNNQEWTMDDLSPSPIAVVNSYTSHDSFAFDIPVQMNVGNIPAEWEKEYISLNGEIKRLSIYVGKVKRYTKSALILPSKVRVVFNEEIDRHIPVTEKPMDFIFEIDPAIWYTDLLPELFHEFRDMYLIQLDKKRAFATGNIEYVDPKFKNIYRVKFSASSVSELKEKLGEFNAGKVFFRYRIEKDYYEMKNELEKKLGGDETFYIFSFMDKFYGAVKE